MGRAWGSRDPLPSRTCRVGRALGGEGWGHEVADGEGGDLFLKRRIEEQAGLAQGLIQGGAEGVGADPERALATCGVSELRAQLGLEAEEEGLEGARHLEEALLDEARLFEG